MTSKQSKLGLWVGLAGCALVLALLVEVLVSTLGSALLFVLPAAVLVLLVAEAVRRAYRATLLTRFRIKYAGLGKDLLIVYTDSPHWQPYIESRWIPRWGNRAVVLNRSRPWARSQIEAKLWRTLGGIVNHTPLAVVIPRQGKAELVRFFVAFRDHKHGKPARLEAAERDLEQALSKSQPDAA
jgi:hypothetical protein